MQIWTLREFNHSKYCITLEFLPYFCSAHSNSSSALIQKLAAAGSFMPRYSLLRSASGVVSVGIACRASRCARDGASFTAGSAQEPASAMLHFW